MTHSNLTNVERLKKLYVRHKSQKIFIFFFVKNTCKTGDLLLLDE